MPTAPPTEPPHLRPRPKRTLAGALATALTLFMATVFSAASAQAAVAHHVYRTCATAGGCGLSLRTGPGTGYARLAMMYDGDLFMVNCFTYGETVNGNPVWLNGVWNGQSGFASDYWIDTTWNTTQDLVNQGIPACASAPAPTPVPAPIPTPPPTPEPALQVTPCVMDMRWDHTNLHFTYPDKHRYYGNAWQSAKNWTDLGTGITITPGASEQAVEIAFIDVNRSGLHYYASAAVPPEWQQGLTTLRTAYNQPSLIYVYVNQYEMRHLNDAQKTYALTHELGHALGLAHTTEEKGCGLNVDSVMRGAHVPPGGRYYPPSNRYPITSYDRFNLEQLYGLPIR